MSAGPSHPGAPLPQPLRRARDDRWLGGVCRGMANRWSTPVGQLRALFAVATLFGGLGLLAYAACWLVLPTDAEEDSPSLLRALASVALLAAAAAGLATIALIAAAATLFGFGWAVVVAIGAFLAGALVLLPTAKPAWVLPPLIAAALPAIAVAASGAELMPQAGLRTERPQRADEIPRDGYRTGLGDL
ncbi:MAG TPA: PspC domain-containing protein, partial [Conexibacter sp.]|nr:PspC domain-containing protein [Conexibacter sp.]